MYDWYYHMRYYTWTMLVFCEPITMLIFTQDVSKIYDAYDVTIMYMTHCKSVILTSYMTDDIQQQTLLK